MWDRGEIKALGKASFKRAYSTAVIVCLILSIINGIFTSANSSVNKRHKVQTNEITNNTFIDISETISSYTSSVTASSGALADGTNDVILFIRNGAASAVILFALCATFASLILRLFILGPLSIGSNRFFMELRENENTPLDRILYIYKEGNLGNSVLTIFLMNLYITLWALLLFIPGIIKTYEYRMVPYILCENPRIERKRAFKLSKEMMTDNKMDSFILDLSFIGWWILSLFTAGILGVLYVNPYMAATNAELYAALREDVLNRNIADETDFPGFGKIDAFDPIM
ncbi:MAG: DUF975 family protein [Lachnospiraceae bacterium]|nr:DUF975 family protein [Lachnospiraceae bacterium]